MIPADLDVGVPVLLRGPDWLVVDKPSGLACHRSRMVRDRDTLARRLMDATALSVHLVHRLDRATSGCLLVALDAATCARLQGALHAARKEYLALVRGFFRWDDPVTVESPVLDASGNPKEALTVVEVLGRSQAPRCSLVRARPETGRFHQVRRHLRDLDHPVIGDRKHGDSKENTRWAEAGLHRLALHCHRLTLPDEGIDVVAPVPPDLGAVIRALPWAAEVAWLPGLEEAPPPAEGDAAPSA